MTTDDPHPDLRTAELRVTDLRTTARLTAEGWTMYDITKALRSGVLVRVKRGVYAPGGAMSVREAHVRLVRAVAEQSANSVISHVSAAVLHGLPVRNAALNRVHVTRPDTGHGKTSAHQQLHLRPLDDGEVVVRDGVRVTSLERTIVDLARSEPFGWAVSAADAALRLGLKRPVLQEAAFGLRHVPGRTKAVGVVAFADAKAESPLESWSRVSIARAGFPAPMLQWEVRDADGEWCATTDFGWPNHGVVGEADGKGKYDDQLASGRSGADLVMTAQRRDETIRHSGWRVSHWGWVTATDHRLLGALLRPYLIS